MRKPFEINGQIIKAGERQTVHLPLPGLHSETTVSMPVHVIHGKKDGPVLFISA
ncbi:MAG: succinylglutamate desuccinylase, partial [Gammaproteobacteria bacterium]|nr:succinylglutamate desuccinylase [Gammaproteobacteria bacterium]